MEIALQIDHAGIPSSTRKRYAELLVARAVRFYIENELDGGVVEEDLYNYEDEYAENMRQDRKNNPYPNLEYGEREEKNWQVNQSALLKSIK